MQEGTLINIIDPATRRVIDCGYVIEADEDEVRYESEKMGDARTRTPGEVEVL